MNDIDKCQTCGKLVQAKEYDPDEDVYLMICEEGHRHWVTDDTETWK